MISALGPCYLPTVHSQGAQHAALPLRITLSALLCAAAGFVGLQVMLFQTISSENVSIY